MRMGRDIIAGFIGKCGMLHEAFRMTYNLCRGTAVKEIQFSIYRSVRFDDADACYSIQWWLQAQLLLLLIQQQFLLFLPV